MESQEPDQDAAARLVDVVGRSVRDLGIAPEVAIERILSDPKHLASLVELATKRLVHVPDLSAEALFEHVRTALKPHACDHQISNWRFDHNKRGEYIAARGVTFEVLQWKPDVAQAAQVDSRTARRYFSERGFSGNASAFFAWHLGLGDAQGRFVCIPDDDACWHDCHDRPWVPYSYVAPHNYAFHLSPLSEPWDVSLFTFVAFRRLSGRT